MEAYEMLKDYIEYIHIKDALALSGQVVPAEKETAMSAISSRCWMREALRAFLSLETHLADFAGLSQLEKEAAVRGRRRHRGRIYHSLPGPVRNPCAVRTARIL